MKLTLIGVNHKTAPLDLREQLAVAEHELVDALARLKSIASVEEAFMVSTCNRVELIVHSTDSALNAVETISAACGKNAEALAQHLYIHRNEAAVRHLFRVASSLDSMVVGEPQILGQIKEAYAIARHAGTVRTELEALLTRAFAVAKRVRTETQVGGSAVNVASVAMDLARKIFGTLQGRTVMLVGAGKMSELAARHVMAHGAEKLYIANRTLERAQRLAAEQGGEAVAFEAVMAMAERVDIIITSTGSPTPIFRASDGEALMKRRKQRPLFFIDIAVPRDVDPKMNDLGSVFVYDMDDLQRVASENASGRKKEADRAEEIITEEVEKFASRVAVRKMAPMIMSLQEHLETIRQAELDKVRGKLGKLSPEQEMAVEALSRGIINKVMHTPVTELKSAARDKAAETTTIIEVMRRMFHLTGNLRNEEITEVVGDEKEQPAAAEKAGN